MTTKAFLASLLGGALMLAWPLAGSAHTHLERSDPADKAALSSPPQSIQLWFSDQVAVEWSKIEVTDSSGKRVDKEKVTANSGDPKNIQIDLGELTAGVYQVKWNVISGDGHRIKGTFTFTVE